MADREYRTLSVETAKLELRAAEGDKLPVIEGYAAVFDALSDDLGGFYERIHAGAFTRTLGERPDAIKAFHNHDQNIVLGSTRKGTLVLEQDNYGLRSLIAPPDNEWGRPVVDAIERGDIEGMSFGFAVPPDGESWEDEAEDGHGIRDVTEIKLFEVSTVSGWPAYPQTSVGVRALADQLGVEDTTLEAAFRALLDPKGELDEEQHELLMSAITKRTSRPYIRPTVVEAQQLMLKRARELGLEA